MREKPLEQFLKDVDGHDLKVLLDNGLYRHLTFSNRGSSIYRFDLITYPGGLLIRGDCGAYCFERMPDMFGFFRHHGPAPITINPTYWSEKCEAQAKHGGIKEFSEEYFLEEVERLVWERFEEEEDVPAADRAVEALKEHLRWEETKHEAQARHVMASFEHEGWKIRDLWEEDFQLYTERFRWNLFAIVWGIQRYDQWKAALAAKEIPS